MSASDYCDRDVLISAIDFPDGCHVFPYGHPSLSIAVPPHRDDSLMGECSQSIMTQSYPPAPMIRAKVGDSDNNPYPILGLPDLNLSTRLNG